MSIYADAIKELKSHKLKSGEWAFPCDHCAGGCNTCDLARAFKLAIDCLKVADEMAEMLDARVINELMGGEHGKT